MAAAARGPEPAWSPQHRAGAASAREPGTRTSDRQPRSHRRQAGRSEAGEPQEPEASVSEAAQAPEDPAAPPDEAEAEDAQFAAKYAGLTRGQLQVRMDKIQDQLRIEVNQAADALLAAGRFEVKPGEYDPDTGGYWFRGSGLENLHKQYSIEGDISRMKRVEMSPTEFPELYRFQSELNWLATQIFRSR